MRYSVLSLIVCLASGPTADAAQGLTVEVPIYEEPEDNAFDYYVRATELLPPEPPWDDMLDQVEEADPADMAVTVLEGQEALEQLRLGIGKPCVIPGQMDFTTPFPYLAGFRSLARLLMLEAWMYAGLDDFGAAFGSCQDALTLGQDCARNGALIHKLVSIACEAVACSHIRRIAGLGAAEEQELADLVGFLAALETNEVPLSETLAVEYTGARRSIEKMKTDPQMREAVAGDSQVHLPVSVIDDALARLEPHYAQLIAIVKTDYWRWTRDEPVPPQGNKLLDMILPAITGAQTAAVRHQAGLRGTLLVAALELYFARNGAYPPELSALAPDVPGELPVDPFCGEAFRYTLLDPLTYQLYSVGPNAADDGGRPESERGAGDGDIVFAAGT